MQFLDKFDDDMDANMLHDLVGLVETSNLDDIHYEVILKNQKIIRIIHINYKYTSKSKLYNDLSIKLS